MGEFIHSSKGGFDFRKSLRAFLMSQPLSLSNRYWVVQSHLVLHQYRDTNFEGEYTKSAHHNHYLRKETPRPYFQTRKRKRCTLFLLAQVLVIWFEFLSLSHPCMFLTINFSAA